MRFARRLRHGLLSPSVELAGRVRELRARGVDIINFGTRPDVPRHVRQAAVAGLDGGASAAYTDVRGLPELRTAIADRPIAELVHDFAACRDAMVRGLRAIPGVSCVEAAGGLFVFPRFAAVDVDSATLSRHLLDDAGVATVPGSAFGDAGEGHLRLLFASPVDEIETGLERVARSLASLRRHSVSR